MSRQVAACFVLLLSLVLTACNAAETAKAFPNPTVDTPLASASTKSKAVLSGGCFWGMQAVFKHLRGVTHVTAGYSGGSADSAHYEMVGTGTTGQAESVEITYDPSKVTYGTILKIFFSVAHNPTELNRQGPDEGTQYRSVIFYAGKEQQKIGVAYINQLNKAQVFSTAHCYSNRSAQSVLCGRRVSSRFCGASSSQSVYHDVRRPQSGPFPRTLP